MLENESNKTGVLSRNFVSVYHSMALLAILISRLILPSSRPLCVGSRVSDTGQLIECCAVGRGHTPANFD